MPVSVPVGSVVGAAEAEAGAGAEVRAVSVYGRYDFVRRTVKSVSMKGGPSVQDSVLSKRGEQGTRRDGPFSRNSSSWEESSPLSSVSELLCLRRARM
jgi:hypothetical protein